MGNKQLKQKLQSLNKPFGPISQKSTLAVRLQFRSLLIESTYTTLSLSLFCCAVLSIQEVSMGWRGYSGPVVVQIIYGRGNSRAKLSGVIIWRHHLCQPNGFATVNVCD